MTLTQLLQCSQVGSRGCLWPSQVKLSGHLDKKVNTMCTVQDYYGYLMLTLHVAWKTAYRGRAQSASLRPEGWLRGLRTRCVLQIVHVLLICMGPGPSCVVCSLVPRLSSPSLGTRKHRSGGCVGGAKLRDRSAWQDEDGRATLTDGFRRLTVRGGQ